MALKYNSVGIVARDDNHQALAAARKLARFAESHGVTVVFEDRTARSLGAKGVEPEKFDVDLLTILGGDGTVLRVVRRLKEQRPLFVINAGSVGFISEVGLTRGLAAFKKVIEGEGRLDTCYRLDVRVNQQKLKPALNEAVLISSTLSKVVTIEARRDGTPIFNGRADGLIIATRMGSTAYALSAGGPVVDPNLDSLVLAPMYPLRLGMRPIVLSNTCNLEISLLEPTFDAFLVVDGQIEGKVTARDTLFFRGDAEPATFIRLGDTFYKRLAERMIKEV